MILLDDNKRNTFVVICDKRNTSVVICDKRNTSVVICDKRNTSVVICDKRNTSVVICDKRNTSVVICDKRNISVVTCGKRNTPVVICDKRNTSVVICDKMNTSVVICYTDISVTVNNETIEVIMMTSIWESFVLQPPCYQQHTNENILTGNTSSRIWYQLRYMYSTGSTGLLLHVNGKFMMGKLKSILLS